MYLFNIVAFKGVSGILLGLSPSPDAGTDRLLIYERKLIYLGQKNHQAVRTYGVSARKDLTTLEGLRFVFFRSPAASTQRAMASQHTSVFVFMSKSRNELTLVSDARWCMKMMSGGAQK